MSQSLGSALDDAARRLKNAGIEDARREARLLAQNAFGLTSTEIILREPDFVSDVRALQHFNAMVARRAAREPLQHILGTVEFFGLDLLCDARALIPRPDSEVVVEAALDVLPEDFSGKIADLGTGSGCLLLALLSQRSSAQGFGIEASAEAAALAAENIQRSGFQARAEILNLRWQDWNGWTDCDLIISNPPYIETSVIDSLEVEVRGHDPMAALDGGADGLVAYRSIFACAANMRPNSWLVLEIGYDQAESVPKLAEGIHWAFRSLKHDLAGNSRALTFQKLTEK